MLTNGCLSGRSFPPGAQETGKHITLLRVIPTMTFIHFFTGKSSGILSDISSCILSGILSGICWHIFLHSIWHFFWHSIWHFFWHSIWHSRWGPAVPTATWKSRLRSGSAHCDLEFAVKIRQCPLRSGSRG